MTTPAEIYEEATFEAKEAAKVAALTNPDVMGTCGSSWVVVRPARGPFVAYLKAQRIGQRGVYGGFEVDFDDGYKGQNVDVKYAASKAFVDVLRKHNIRAAAYQRLT